MAANGLSSPTSAGPGGLVAPPQMDSKQQPYYNKSENGTPLKPHQPLPPQQQQQQFSPPKPQLPPPSSTTPLPPSTTTISLADIDPKTVPEHLKLEGMDWFAL